MAWKCVRAGALGLSFLLAVSVPTSAQNSGEIYFNLSDDPDALQLLGLGNIVTENGQEYVDLIEMYRGEAEHGMIATWAIDCPREEMGIVRGMLFGPDGSEEQRDIDGERISPRGTPQAWRMFQLVCSGKGQLEERRVFYGPLGGIIDRFWGR